jgi:hypothetical protein
VKVATIGICTLADLSVWLNDCQQLHRRCYYWRVDSKKKKGKHHVAHMQYCLLESDSDEEEVGLAERSRNARPVKCPYVKQGVSPGERYDFDESKCDKIFDLLL